MAEVNARRIAWVLGAGFSRSLGGPLLEDMFSKKTLEETVHKFKALQTDEYRKLYDIYETYRRPEGGFVLWKHAEEFLDYIDTARKTGPRQDLLKTLIKDDMETFYGRCIQAIAAENSFASVGALGSEPWLPYVDWAGTLTGLDSVITFNYDLVLETLGAHEKVRFLGPETVYEVSGVASKNPRANATIYKLHGSIDWVNPERKNQAITRGDPNKLLESPTNMLIASPGPTKKLHREGHLNSIWIRAMSEIRDADAIVLCGYRFPPSDSESRRLLLKAIKENDRPDLRIHIVLGQPDAKSLPAIERLKSLLRSVLLEKRGEGPRPKENERKFHFEVIVHPLYAEDFFSVMNRDAITHVTYPPYKV